MGVCECSRNGCDTVCCKVLTVFGDYICNDCQRDFIELMSSLGYTRENRDFFDEQLKLFLTRSDKIDISDYFEK